MFEVSVEREFCAAHALMISGRREPVHGHNFHVTVTVMGERLDADGLLVDFHALERLVDRVIEPFVNADLGEKPPFEGGKVNASAERIAEYVGVSVSENLAGVMGRDGPKVRLGWVRVTEAPGCSVVFRP